MIILAIDTSCDDTSIAIIKASKAKRSILSNVVSSQIEIHKKWGGVYPTLAVREHKKNLPMVLKKALQKAKNPKIGIIAVTVGPGLDPCLWAGINFAKELAQKWDLPTIPVNHIEAHILVNLVNGNIKFPAIALIVSGGHTQLVLVKDIKKYKILGETRDDAAGECFDKVARILGLGYPGGPIISREAAEARPPQACGGRASAALSLPRPMINSKDYDFSFSGLKTAVWHNVKKQKRKSQKYIAEMCREVQQSIIDVLIKKTIKAARDYNVESIILGGGVSANSELRKQFKKKFNNVLIPPKRFSTDNAVMIAVAGYYNLSKKTKKYNKIKADANLRIC